MKIKSQELLNFLLIKIGELFLWLNCATKSMTDGESHTIQFSLQQYCIMLCTTKMKKNGEKIN